MAISPKLDNFCREIITDLLPGRPAAAAALLVWVVPETPWKLIGFGRRMASQTGNWQLLYVADGMNFLRGIFQIRRPDHVLPRQRQGGSFRRASGYAPAKAPRSSARASAQEPEVGARGRLRRRSHRRQFVGSPRGGSTSPSAKSNRASRPPPRATSAKKTTT